MLYNILHTSGTARPHLSSSKASGAARRSTTSGVVAWSAVGLRQGEVMESLGDHPGIDMGKP